MRPLNDMLTRLDQASADHLFDAWEADPDAFLRAAAASPRALFGGLDQAAGRVHPRPSFHADALAAAVFSAAGQKVWVDARFDAWLAQEPVDACEIRATLATGSSRTFVHHAPGRGSVLLVCVCAAQASAWPLADDLRAALQAAAGGALVLAISTAAALDAAHEAARAYGLTPMEARLAVALLRAGNLRAAAALAGLSYGAARQAMKIVLRKTGAPRQSALVGLLSRSVTGLLRDQAAERACLIDSFGLRRRDANLALLIAEGLTRVEAAAVANISPAVAKDAFERIFEQMGVSASAEIGRHVVEVRAAHLIASASGGNLILATPTRDPLRFIQRPSGGFIATSDYGPAGGRPLILIHTSMTTRHPSRRFVKALQAAGLRPIAIDRPGFGLSDPHTDDMDPFAAASDDMACVLDRLELPQAAIIARGGASVALAFAKRYGARLERVVLINPDAPTAEHSKRSGLVGAMKDFAFRHPEQITALARMAATQATPERVARFMQKAMRASPLDFAAISEPEEMADYQRSVLLFASGRVAGMINELKAYARGVDDYPLSDAHDWRVLIGRHNPNHYSNDIEAFWRPRLPNATFEVIAEGGRFLHLTHPDRVIRMLTR
jgi:pimeloyl-ACP methyl ester carboxylesterase/DNA-binding CsgD family transcriptional regulator